MEKQRMVVLKNMINGNVSVKKPQYGVNRTWTRMGQPMAIPFDLVEQLLWDTGFNNMIRSGILYIENMQDKIDLGLEPEGAVEPENIIVLSQDQIKALWTVKTLAEFKEEIKKLPMTQIDAITEYAVANKIVKTDKAEFLKEYAQKDVLKAIVRKQESEEIDKREAAKAAQAAKDKEDGRRV